jgi:cyclohexanone monooxygenase
MWDHGGAIFTSTYGDLITSRAANETAAEFVRSKIRAQVHDPRVAALLAPTDHPLGSKRPCVDGGYFETFNLPNVELVDLRREPIERITNYGVQTSAREIDVDALVFATGFDAITGTVARIDIRGRGGRALADHWRDGPRALLGRALTGIPNMFVITGPGSPSVLCNMTVSIEQHVEWVHDLLVWMNGHGHAVAEATPHAEADWASHVNDIADATLLVEGNSWYLGANIPGKPRTFMPYAGGMAAYDAEAQAIASAGYPGFRFQAADEASDQPHHDSATRGDSYASYVDFG